MIIWEDLNVFISWEHFNDVIGCGGNNINCVSGIGRNISWFVYDIAMVL